MCVIVCDLSLHGCKIETAQPMENLGSTVIIELTDRVSVVGTIVWVDELFAGVRFKKRLDVSRFGFKSWTESVGESVEMREIDQAA